MHRISDDLRGRRWILLRILAALLAVGLGSLGGLLGDPLWGWVALCALVLQALLEVWLTVGRAHRRRRMKQLTGMNLPVDLVDRPELVTRVVRLIVDHAGRQPVGITATAALTGAGGFGKTTLSALVCADERVTKHFDGGQLQIIIGQSSRDGDLAAKINDVVEELTGERPGFTDPERAGKHLLEVLSAGPRKLLILDDVWTQDQLSPFLAQGNSIVTVLITTRVPDLLPPGSPRVLVDQMTAGQAEQMLRAAATLPHDLQRDLLRVTGRWPLLLSLVCGRLRATAADDGDVVGSARLALEHIVRYGPAALDITVTADRARAVSLSIDLSLALVPTDDAPRFNELGIFPEDAEIPFAVVALLWSGTGQLTEQAAHMLCQRLATLSLIGFRSETGTIVLHDVIRAYVRGPDNTANRLRLADINQKLLAAAAVSLLPATTPRAWWRLPDDAAYLWRHICWHIRESGDLDGLRSLATDLHWITAKLQRFGVAAAEDDLRLADGTVAEALRRSLATSAHLLTPADPPEALNDILVSRITGVAELEPLIGPFAASQHHRPVLLDTSPPAEMPNPALRRVLPVTGQMRALTIDGTPQLAVINRGTVDFWNPSSGTRLSSQSYDWDDRVVRSAVDPKAEWVALAYQDRTTYKATIQVINVSTGATRILTTDASSSDHIISDVGVAGDGRYVVWTYRYWGPHVIDMTTAQKLPLKDDFHTYPKYPDEIKTVDLAPDNSFVYTTGQDGTVRVWYLSGDRPAARLFCSNTGSGEVETAVSSDSRLLATAGDDDIARVWDVNTAIEIAQFNAKAGPLGAKGGSVFGIAFDPDGRLLAISHHNDGTVRLWRWADGQVVGTLTGHGDAAGRLAFASDNTWMATGSASRVHVWDLANINAQESTTDITNVHRSPDRTWLAAATADDVIHFWNLSTKTKASLDSGIYSRWSIQFAPSGLWFAVPKDGQITIVSVPDGRVLSTMTAPFGANSRIRISPDSSWLVTCGMDQEPIRVWLAATGRLEASFKAHMAKGWTWPAVTISPDGTILAMAHTDFAVQLWNRHTGMDHAILTGHIDTVREIVFAHDGSWLATVGLDDTVRIWETSTGRNITVLRHTNPHKLTAAPDGSALIIDGLVIDTSTWQLRAALDQRPDTSAMWWSISTIVASDGAWIAEMTDRKSIHIWDGMTGTQRAATSGTFTTMATTPSGNWLAAGEHGGTLSVWDCTTGQRIAMMRVDSPILLCEWLDSTLIVITTRGWRQFSFRNPPSTALPSS